MKKRKSVRPSCHKHAKARRVRESSAEPVVANAISRKLNMTEDMIAKAPILMGYGTHRFCIENYRNIIEYTQELVRIQTKTVRIHIIGRNLSIAYFRDDGMCVVGDVCRVEYHTHENEK